MKVFLAILAAIVAVGFAPAFAAAPAQLQECASGYMPTADACTLRAPLNAKQNAAGGWSCNQGFFEANGACNPVPVPRNAHLTASGHSWTCDSGFDEADRACRPAAGRPAVLPVHAVLCPEYEDPAGRDCIPQEKPTHAVRAPGSLFWSCIKGYQEMSGKCMPVDIPRNAVVGVGGMGWTCDWGFRPVQGKCVEIDIPNNASLGYFGDVWNCNRGYYEIRGICLPDTKDHKAMVAKTSVMYREEPVASSPAPARMVARMSAHERGIGMAAAVGFAVAGFVIFLMREQPQRRTATYKMAYAPRQRGSGLALTWRSFGNRVDALTGAPIATSANTAQCRNCRAWYHAESAATLARENGARCLACNRVALTQQNVA